jgi:hypothetical protein
VATIAAQVPNFMHPVAAGHDTSITMIERNYSRYIIDHADALVRGDLRAPP